MPKVRKQRWADHEIEVIQSHYRKGDWKDILRLLPGRTRSQVQNKAYGLGIIRHREPARTPEHVLAAKREQMAERRRADPDAARAYSRRYHHRNREKQTAKMRHYYGRRFFWARSCKLRQEGKADFRQLAALWKAQRGRCALTGRRLTRDNAQLDHIVPKVKGGGDEIGNLRWLCIEANMAKRDMTDEQFIALCAEVTAFIGERIEAVRAAELNGAKA